MLFLVIASDPVRGQATAPPSASLPPAAQEALDKGIIAAKVPDYPLAIRYFEEARKLAPLAPVIFMNLGIAESKMPGRELRAIAWFGAYLAALPGAQNAAAVKEQIAVLEVRNQSNVSRLIKTAQDTANQAPPGDGKDLNLVYMAELWAKAGDIAAATRAAELIQGDRKGQGQSLIAKVQAKAGDIAGAQKTADGIREPFFLGDVQLAIAEAQIKAADNVGAKRTLTSAISTADRFQMPWYAYDKSSRQIAIAEMQVKAGDTAGAQKTLAAVSKNSKLIEKASLRPHSRMVTAQLNAGDIAGAQKTAALILDGYQRSDALAAIARTQIGGGDIPGAKETLASSPKFIVPLPDASVRNARLSIVARSQLEIGDITGAQKTVGLMQIPSDRSFARYGIARAQIETGDIAGAQGTADLIEEAQWKEPARRAIAAARATAGSAATPGPVHLPTTTAKAPVQHPELQPAITVSDWLQLLDNSSESGDCALNTGPFLDLAGHLKSLPRSDTSQGIVGGLLATANKLVTAGMIVRPMLKRQRAP